MSTAAPGDAPHAVPDGAPQTQPAPAWMQLAAEDLQTLAWLHACERPSAVLHALREHGFPGTLSLLTADDPAVQAMQAALGMAGSAGCSDDDLAADYASIYLTHSLRAAPLESVWRDEDHLMLQAPTFAVRAFYRRHGIQVANWRERPDDHLTHELNFIAHLLQQGKGHDAARFMAQHLMQWLPDFARRVAQRAATPVYAALGVLTHACCAACQQRLPQVAVMPPVVAARDERPSGCSG